MKTIKIIAGLFIFSVIVFSCKTSQEKEGKNDSENSDNKVSQILFISNVHDFGIIPFQGNGRCYFKFTNVSDEDLIINNVRTTCGCTRPEWPEKPIPPGGEGTIGISYNTKLPGQFSKAITVYSNAENSPVKLFIKGKVEPQQSN